MSVKSLKELKEYIKPSASICSDELKKRIEADIISINLVIRKISSLETHVRERIKELQYCDECKHLEPTEKEQVDLSKRHWCQKYKQRVLHFDVHPKLNKVWECYPEEAIEELKSFLGED